MNLSRPSRSTRFLFVALAALSASRAPADDRACGPWQAPALMEARQSTLGGLPVYFQLRQKGSQLLGWAQYQTTRKTVIGNVIGDITGDGIHLRVLWTYSGDPSIGRYTGTIRPRPGGIVGDTQYGYVFEGSTYDEYRNPPEYATWSATHFSCQLPALRTGLTLGRVAPRNDGPGPPICDAARSARARKSPAAPGLERQCLASGGTMKPPILGDSGPVAASATQRSARVLALDGAEDAARARGVDEAYGAETVLVDSSHLDAARIDALAATGAAMAQWDPDLANARLDDDDAASMRGFDIASGLFGDPALGAQGNTQSGPGSDRIRDALDSAGRRGFAASVAFHLARHYAH